MSAAGLAAAAASPRPAISASSSYQDRLSSSESFNGLAGSSPSTARMIPQQPSKRVIGFKQKESSSSFGYSQTKLSNAMVSPSSTSDLSTVTMTPASASASAFVSQPPMTPMGDDESEQRQDAFKTKSGFDASAVKPPISPNTKANLFSVVSRNTNTSQLTKQLSMEFGKKLELSNYQNNNNNNDVIGELSEEHAKLLKSAMDEYPDTFGSESVQTAFKVCVEAHSGNGHTPLLLDCVGTAKILCDLGADDSIVAAALLHDVPNTTLLNEGDLLRQGIEDDVVKLTIDVGKLTLVSNLHRASERDLDIEEINSLREMLFAMTDSRVVSIKLAKRLQIMRTIEENSSRSRRGKLAEETLAVFVPIAHRLGMTTIKNDLEDISFKTLHPEHYKELKVQLNSVSQKDTILKAMEAFEYAISNDTSMEELKPMEIVGREKGLYSVYKKMKKKGIKLEDVRDVRAIRIIIPDDAGKNGCNLVIKKVHELMQPVQGSFKDYISSPKFNGYQSLHTVVKDENGNTLEVQVRTLSMHRHAEFGVAAHWRYKVHNGSNSSLTARVNVPVDETQIRWVRYVLSFQQELKDETKIRLPGKLRGMYNICPFPEHNETCKFNKFDESSAPTNNVDDGDSSSSTFVILIIDGQMSIRVVPEGSKLSEVDLLNDQKALPKEPFSSEFVGIRSVRVNRENVDIEDVKNFTMKLGDLIEVTRSRINRYPDYGEKILVGGEKKEKEVLHAR